MMPSSALELTCYEIKLFAKAALPLQSHVTVQCVHWHSTIINRQQAVSKSQKGQASCFGGFTIPSSIIFASVTNSSGRTVSGRAWITGSKRSKAEAALQTLAASTGPTTWSVTSAGSSPIPYLSDSLLSLDKLICCRTIGMQAMIL